MFDSLTNRLGGVFERLRGKGRLTEADVDAALREVRLALLEADVNVAVARSFLNRVKERAIGAEVTKSLTPGQQVVKIVHEELITTLGAKAESLKAASSPPQTILMVGLQGSGKTTTAAKLAKRLKSSGKRPLLVAVRKVADPDDVLLVVDSMTGQDAVNVAQGFLEQTDITGLVFSKLDGDARGGAAISAREVTGRPIKFIGVGEGIDDLEVFHPERLASRILGMGDVMTLIERAEATWDQEQAEEAAEKMLKAQFTLEDFLDQFQQLRQMGPLNQLLGMLPGAASALKNADVSEKDLSRVEAIIRSMTPEERRNPKVIDGSRKRRIARGSGTTPQDVNGLLRQFAETQKMMKAFAGGRSPIPGLAIPGTRRRRRN
ncbi:MAG TPA: signal recognition particle protein [Acidimicrobiia bacterium]|nr:signal recognition particle protein [Acidimicrobiia bacterium]